MERALGRPQILEQGVAQVRFVPGTEQRNETWATLRLPLSTHRACLGAGLASSGAVAQGVSPALGLRLPSRGTTSQVPLATSHSPGRVVCKQPAYSSSPCQVLFAPTC